MKNSLFVYFPVTDSNSVEEWRKFVDSIIPIAHFCFRLNEKVVVYQWMFSVSEQARMFQGALSNSLKCRGLGFVDEPEDIDFKTVCVKIERLGSSGCCD